MANYLKAKNSFTVISDSVLDDPELTANEVLVYITLKKFSNNATKTAFPSLSTLAKKSRISRSSVQRALNGLCEKGYIIRKQRYNKETKEYRSNLYIILDKKTTPEQRETDSKLEQLKSLAAELGYKLSKDDEGPDHSTLDQVKEACDYDSMTAENPDITDAIDSTMQVIADTLDDKNEKKEIKEAFRKLTKREVLYSIRKLQQSRNIKNTTAYLKTILARASAQAGLEGVPRGKSAHKKNRFNDFEQRKYSSDFLAKLEKAKRGRKK